MLSTDKRWKELGEVLTHYCLEVKPGQKVMIAQYEVETWPLALATYESVIKAGGFPQIQLKSEYLRRALAIFEEIKSPYAEQARRILEGLDETE